MKFRGVTLVELALVIGILGLLMGIYLAKAQTLAAEQRWDDVERELAGVRHAVLLYAAKNRTGQRRIEVYDSDAGRVISADILPGGRPILPCPDVNGDGYEDRQGEGEIPPVGATMTIIIGGPAVASNRIDTDENPLLQFGNCVLMKGALPWRNLPGIRRETDPWGNLYTYRVDSNYANRLIGFDEYTRADSFDARMPWIQSSLVAGAIEPWPAKRATDPAQMEQRQWTQLRRSDPLIPLVQAMLTVNERPSIVCEEPPCPPLQAELIAGDNRILAGMLATTAITIITARRFSEGLPPARVRRSFAPPPGVPTAEYEIIEGLPFIVLSHGREDRGARVSHKKRGPSSPPRGVFMQFPLQLDRASDVNNAMDFGLGQIPTSDWVEYDSALSSGSFSLTDPAIESSAANWSSRFRLFLMDNGFTQPRGVRVVDHRLSTSDAQPAHDDVVTWMTEADLRREALRLRILPAPPLPPFGVED